MEYIKNIEEKIKVQDKEIRQFKIDRENVKRGKGKGFMSLAGQYRYLTRHLNDEEEKKKDLQKSKVEAMKLMDKYPNCCAR